VFQLVSFPQVSPPKPCIHLSSCPYVLRAPPISAGYWQWKTEVPWEKPAPVPICPLQITHGLTWNRTRASAVTGRRLTAWTMDRPTANFWFWVRRITYTVSYCGCISYDKFWYVTFCATFVGLSRQAKFSVRIMNFHSNTQYFN
jgi:hypothetical protein